MAFMKDILTRNIPIWEECAATPFCSLANSSYWRKVSPRSNISVWVCAQPSP
jgi:hypothetical protein